jgi:hypothetical protein
MNASHHGFQDSVLGDRVLLVLVFSVYLCVFRDNTLIYFVFRDETFGDDIIRNGV